VEWVCLLVSNKIAQLDLKYLPVLMTMTSGFNIFLPLQTEGIIKAGSTGVVLGLNEEIQGLYHLIYKVS